VSKVAPTTTTVQKPTFANVQDELSSRFKKNKSLNPKSKSKSKTKSPSVEVFNVNKWRGGPDTSERRQEYVDLMALLKTAKTQYIPKAKKVLEHYDHVLANMRSMTSNMPEAKQLFDAYFKMNPAGRNDAIKFVEGSIREYERGLGLFSKNIDFLLVRLPRLYNVNLVFLPTDVGFPRDVLKLELIVQLNPARKDVERLKMFQDMRFYTEYVELFVEQVLPRLNVQIAKDIGVGPSKSISASSKSKSKTQVLKPSKSKPKSKSKTRSKEKANTKPVMVDHATMPMSLSADMTSRRSRLMVVNRHRPRLPMELTERKGKAVATLIDTLVHHRDPNLSGCEAPDGCITQPLRLGPSLSPYYIHPKSGRKTYCPRINAKCIS
jgi:hypothetical protein